MNGAIFDLKNIFLMSTEVMNALKIQLSAGVSQRGFVSKSGTGVQALHLASLAPPGKFVGTSRIAASIVCTQM